MSDKELNRNIKEISKHDKNSLEALRKIYEEYKKDVYTFILIYCKDRFAAEDLVQETFISIYKTAKNYRVFTNPKAWILTIAKNITVSYIKKDKSLSDVSQINELTINNSSFEKIMTGELYAESILDLLAEDEKEIVVLHVIYGFKHREIAKIISLPLGTVTWKYKKSIDFLRTKISVDENFIIENNLKGVIPDGK